MFGSLAFRFRVESKTSFFQHSTTTTLIPKYNTLQWHRNITIMPRGVQNPNHVNVNLNNLQDNYGALRRKKRVGRGAGSGKGKTAGRGHKGQKARSGGGSGPWPGFEGGQTPLFKKVRKYGFHNPFSIEHQVVNLDKLQDYISLGRIDPTKVITMKTLFDAGVIRKPTLGVKLLANGVPQFTTPINIEVTQASKREAIGGTVKTVYYNKLGLRFLFKPHKFVFPIQRAIAPPKERYKYDDWGQERYNALRPVVPEKKTENKET